MNILISGMEVCGHIDSLAKAWRSMGHRVTTMPAGNHHLFADRQYDISLQQATAGSQVIFHNPDTAEFQPSPLLEKLIDMHEVFVFLWGTSLAPGNLDLPYLKSRGKKVISLLVGGDARHWSAAMPLVESWNVPYWPRHAEFWNSSLPTLRDTCAEWQLGPMVHRLSTRMHVVRMAELYGDAVFSVPDVMGLAVKPYHHFRALIDIDLVEQEIHDRDRPVIVHAPTDRAVKGSQSILQALTELAREFDFEVVLLENMQNHQVLEHLSNADILVDAGHDILHGTLAAEALAAGCVVLAGAAPGLVPYYPDSPIVPITVFNVKEQLRRVLADRELRRSLAPLGRPFVQTHHESIGFAQAILAGLEDGNVPDYRNDFFALDYRAPQKDFVPDFLKRSTLDAIERFGLPSGAALSVLAERGLVPAGTTDRALPAVTGRHGVVVGPLGSFHSPMFW